jgi:hypothetical protein
MPLTSEENIELTRLILEASTLQLNKHLNTSQYLVYKNMEKRMIDLMNKSSNVPPIIPAPGRPHSKTRTLYRLQRKLHEKLKKTELSE